MKSIFRPIASRAIRKARDLKMQMQYRLDHGQKISGSFRVRGAPSVAVVLAGYKPALWRFTLDRLPPSSDDLDVCLVGAGRYNPILADLASSRGWSYAVTNGPWPGPALNAAIARHPAAALIHKLDEDMILPRDYFARMQVSLKAFKEEDRHFLGFLAPLINVNGYSYAPFLSRLGLAQEYRRRFGEFKQAAERVRAHYDGEAALYIWRQTLPFDVVAARFEQDPPQWTAVPHRFSIGAILLERSFWQEIGGFRRIVGAPVLGCDEEVLCRSCVERSRVMAVDHRILVGHFSFGPQEKVMLDHLSELEPGLQRTW